MYQIKCHFVLAHCNLDRQASIEAACFLIHVKTTMQMLLLTMPPETSLSCRTRYEAHK